MAGDPGRERVLLISARSVSGSWIFPTGTVEPGESLADTALRECEEESGYHVRLGPRLGTIALEKPESTHLLTFFLARVIGETVEVQEPDRARRWCSPEEGVKLVAEPFRPIAEAARRLLAEGEGG